MMVSGMIQQPMEIMFMVLDKCCEKKIFDLCGCGVVGLVGGGQRPAGIGQWI